MKLHKISEVLNQAILYENAVRSYQKRTLTESSNPIESALEALQTMASNNNITIAIVGGAATAYHGYPRSTKDVDIVLNTKDYSTFMRMAHSYGFTLLTYSDWMLEMVYEHPQGTIFNAESTPAYTRGEIRGVLVEVMCEGMNDFPPPEELGVTSGLGFADLKSYILLKLKAFRAQDIADIVAVLKAQSDQVAEVRNFIETEHPERIDDLDLCLRMLDKETKKR